MTNFDAFAAAYLDLHARADRAKSNFPVLPRLIAEMAVRMRAVDLARALAETAIQVGVAKPARRDELVRQYVRQLE